MHEVGLMQEAVRIAATHAQSSGAARIYVMTMRIGALAGVEVEALRLAFEVVTQGTTAEGATLQLEKVPVGCWCNGCERVFQPADCVFRCPKCHHPSTDIRQGREFEVIAVEVS
jgi:hydrogenase nickel incorporation protein HypA/HybF